MSLTPCIVGIKTAETIITATTIPIIAFTKLIINHPNNIIKEKKFINPFDIFYISITKKEKTLKELNKLINKMNKKVLYKTYLHFNNVFGWIWLVLVSCFCIFLIVTFLFSPTIHNAKFYDLYHFIGYIFGQLFKKINKQL